MYTHTHTQGAERKNKDETRNLDRRIQKIMRQRPGTGAVDPSCHLLCTTHPCSHSRSLFCIHCPSSLHLISFPSPFSLPLSFLPHLTDSHFPPSSSSFFHSPPPAGAPLDSDIPTSVFHPPTRETALTPTSTFGPKPFLFVPEQVRRPKHSFVPRKVSPVCVSRENGENGERVKSFSLPPPISQGAATNHRSCSRLSSHFESSGSVHMHFSTTYVKSIVYVHVLKRNL